MNLKSLIPVGRQREMARTDNPFFSLQREIDRLFDDFRRGFPGMLPATGNGIGNGAMLPTMDVAETDKEIEITAELPGLEEKDVQINVADNVLTIRARRKPRRKRRTRTTAWSSAATAPSSVRCNCRTASMPTPSRPASTRAC